jgi:hypothetical protein
LCPRPPPPESWRGVANDLGITHCAGNRRIIESGVELHVGVIYVLLGQRINSRLRLTISIDVEFAILCGLFYGTVIGQTHIYILGWRSHGYKTDD